MFSIFERLFGKEQEMTPYMNEVLTAAREGNPEAQHCLGVHYKYGTEGFRKNGTAAMEWLRKAAEQEYVPAFGALAHVYLEGAICSRSNELFIKWASRYLQHMNYGLESTDPIQDGFAKEIGYYYLKGDGVEQDFEEAVRWLATPAYKDDAEAQLAMGLAFYTDGSSMHSPVDAFYWFKRSAEQNNTNAQRSLGLCYLLGEGVEANMEAARYWFSRAAEQGDERAMYALKEYCGC